MLLQFFFHLDGSTSYTADGHPTFRRNLSNRRCFKTRTIGLMTFWWPSLLEIMRVDRQEIAHVDTQNLLVPYIHIYSLLENVFSKSISQDLKEQRQKKHSDLWGEFQGWILRFASGHLEEKSCPKTKQLRADLVFVKNLIRNKLLKRHMKKIPPTKYENEVSHFHPDSSSNFWFLWSLVDFWIILFCT